jgi:2-polyprenyl-6-methoxyphenol hydroxylase-like FAD-dependent oxidoreductase
MNPDVLVCGAGAGGLAAARAFGALGLRVLVVDKQERQLPIAKGEVLQPGALRVLREWGVEQALDELSAVRLGRLVVRDHHGASVMALEYDQLPAGDRQLMAHDHTTILAALADGLGPSVELRRGVLAGEPLRDGAGRITGVHLAGEEVTAGLVIAADGVSSKLRRAVGIDAERVDYAHRLVSFEISGKDLSSADFSAYLTDRGLRLVYPLPGDRTRLYVQVEPNELRGATPAALADWCARMLSEIPALEGLTEPLLAQLDTRQLLPVSKLLSPTLTVPGMALLGEAAYAVHPMAAQGMNTAITSAAALAGHVAAQLERNGELTPETVDSALRDYEKEHFPKLTHAARTSANAARMVTDLSWPGRVLGRRAVRHTGANPRLLHTVTYNMAGLGPRPLTALDRLQQLGVLPDPRAHRVPA